MKNAGYSKNGQVTLFVIFGAMIVLSILFLVYFGGSGEDTSNVSPKRTSGVNGDVVSLLESCLDIESENGLRLMASFGTYLEKNESIIVEDVEVNYLYYDEENKLEDIEDVQSRLTEFLNKSLVTCLDDFSDLKKRRYGVHLDKLDATSKFIGSDVIFYLNYSVVLEKNNISKNFESRYVNIIDVNFLKYYEAIDNILDMREMYPNLVDMYLLADQGLNISFTQQEDSIIYILEDENSSLPYEEDYLMLFAVELGGDNEVI
jgi:hypothetical protein